MSKPKLPRVNCIACGKSCAVDPRHGIWPHYPPGQGVGTPYCTGTGLKIVPASEKEG